MPVTVWLKGCNVGAQQRELELEQSACTQHEEEHNLNAGRGRSQGELHSRGLTHHMIEEDGTALDMQHLCTTG